MTLIEKFEDEFGKRGYSLHRHHADGVYSEPMTEGAWRGYEAAHQQPMPNTDDKPNLFRALVSCDLAIRNILADPNTYRFEHPAVNEVLAENTRCIQQAGNPSPVQQSIDLGTIPIVVTDEETATQAAEYVDNAARKALGISTESAQQSICDVPECPGFGQITGLQLDGRYVPHLHLGVKPTESSQQSDEPYSASPENGQATESPVHACKPAEMDHIATSGDEDSYICRECLGIITVQKTSEISVMEGVRPEWGSSPVEVAHNGDNVAPSAPSEQPDDWPADYPDKALTSYLTTGNGGNLVLKTSSWFADIKRAFFAGFTARDEWSPRKREPQQPDRLSSPRPCPFCGGLAGLVDDSPDSENGGNYEVYYVACTTCDASIDPCPDREMAWRSWNMRTTPERESRPLTEGELRDAIKILAQNTFGYVTKDNYGDISAGFHALLNRYDVRPRP